jgi:2-polyprenyl-6-methoxyphenol hydroxylase-like FAD-dependent oxidoreductase
VTDVLVVGAGIGGLTFASALARLAPGIGIEVVERDRDPLSRAQGYSVGLHRAHGLGVLERLGLAADVASASTHVPELRLLSVAGGTLRRVRMSGRDARGVFAAVPRGRLRELLASTLPSGTVAWNARAVRFDQSETRAEVELEGGEVRTADVVVACDGARSAARRQVLGDELRYVGLSRVGGIADRFAHPLLEGGPFMTLGTGCSTFVHPLADDRLVWSFTTRAAEDELLALDASELLHRAAVATAGWHAPIAAVIAGTDEADVDVRGLYDVEPPTRARSGRIVFLGDASHATTPYRGTGANMAMVDALELVEELARAGDGPIERALAAYERRMLPRNRAAVRRSHAASQSLHPATRLGALSRNARLRAANLLAALPSR